MSFRARITVLVAVVVGLAVVVMALASLQATRSQVYGELDRSLAQVARVASEAPAVVEVMRARPSETSAPENTSLSWGNLIKAGSVFVGADTFLGPAILAYGVAEAGRKRLYLAIGDRF